MARVIDADGHIVEPRAVWEQYTEPAYRTADRIARFAVDIEEINARGVAANLDHLVAIATATAIRSSFTWSVIRSNSRPPAWI